MKLHLKDSLYSMETYSPNTTILYIDKNINSLGTQTKCFSTSFLEK